MLHTQHTLTGIHPATARTILVVEDDPGIGEMLIRILVEETDYDCHLVTKPSEAIDVLEQMTPFLLLLDFHLPSIDGLELYDLLQILIGGDPLPAIIMSGERSPYLLDGIKQRKLLVLQKPFDVDVLIDTIDVYEPNCIRFSDSFNF